MGDGPKTAQHKTRRKLSVAERRKLVAANMLAGASYRDIAAALGVSKSTVANDFKAIIKEWREQYTDDIDSWAKIQLRRLDVLINAIWDRARNGDYQAIDRVMKLMHQQSKLLGIEGPTVDVDLNVRGVVGTVGLNADDLAAARDAVAAFEEDLLSGSATE